MDVIIVSVVVDLTTGCVLTLNSREAVLSDFYTVHCLSACRHLAGEVAKEWQEVEENDKTQQETLLKLVKEIVPYNMAHNAEHEACDLLMEIERLDMLEDYIDENAYGKVCLYLTRYVVVFILEMKFFW